MSTKPDSKTQPLALSIRVKLYLASKYVRGEEELGFLEEIKRTISPSSFGMIGKSDPEIALDLLLKDAIRNRSRDVPNEAAEEEYAYSRKRQLESMDLPEQPYAFVDPVPSLPVAYYNPYTNSQEISNFPSFHSPRFPPSALETVSGPSFSSPSSTQMAPVRNGY